MLRAVPMILMLISILPSLRADEFELAVRKVALNEKNAGLLPHIELEPGNTRQFEKEPRYRSQNPQKFLMRMGGSTGIDVAFVVDEIRGTGKGYNCLLVDVTGSGDLTEAKKLTGKNALRGSSHMDAHFPPVDIQVPCEKGVEPYPFKVRFTWRRDDPSDSVLVLSPLCVLEGKVRFGEKEQSLILFDADCNGACGEPGSPFDMPVRGDRIWLGEKPPKLEEAYASAIPAGRTVRFEDDYFEFTFSGNNEEKRVEITKTDAPMGMIELTHPDFTLELMQGSEVLHIAGDGKELVGIPAGSYRIHNVWFRGKHKGGTYELVGKPGTFKDAFIVEEDNVTPLKLGPPLKIRITTGQKTVGTGTEIDFESVLEGCGGEVYQRLMKNGRRHDHPLMIVKNPQGKTVHKGMFNYDRRQRCVYTWRLQSTIRDGIFSLETVLDTGPFAQDEEFRNTLEISR